MQGWGIEEGRSVVAAAPALRRYPPCEQGTLAGARFFGRVEPTHRARCRAMNGAPGNLTNFEYRFNCRIDLYQFADSTFWLG